MRIISYEFQEESSFEITKTTFGKINLLVGDTGTGKSKFINTLFNLGVNLVSRKNDPLKGIWETVLLIDGNQYELKIIIDQDPLSSSSLFSYERLSRYSDEDKKDPIFERNNEKLIFLGESMPRMDRSQSVIKMLKDEDSIKPIYSGFSNIMVRRFSEDDLASSCRLQPIPQSLLFGDKQNFSLEKLYHSDFGLNLKLYLLSKHHPSLYLKIREDFKTIFPFITDSAVLDINDLHKKIAIPGKVPVFCIKEKDTTKWIELQDLSSGMKKTLLLLTDMFIAPEGSIFLLDEYENSLGINAINFFPDLIYSTDKDIQLFITSHHPYIINNFPMKDWYIFHRRANKINLKHGQDLIEKYGKSKQEAFVQLINDPYFRNGIE